MLCWGCEDDMIPARKWQSQSEEDEEVNERLHDEELRWGEKVTDLRMSITAYEKRLEEIRIRLNEIKKVKRSAVADVLAEKETLLAEDARLKEKRSMYISFEKASKDLAHGYAEVQLMREDARWKVHCAREEARLGRNNFQPDDGGAEVEDSFNKLRLEKWVQSSSDERRAALERPSEPNEGGAELERPSEPNEEGAEVERPSEPNEVGAEANDGGAEIE